MTVPEGKTVYIGQRKYKSGDKLPDGYKLPEKKQEKKAQAEPAKAEKE